MKTLQYISIAAVFSIASSLSYVTAQEYDDLYYDPKSDAPEKTEQQDEHVKSDYERYREFNPKTCSLIINEARALAIKELLPLLAEGA